MSSTKINWYKVSIGIIGLLLTVTGNLISVPLTQKVFYFLGSCFLITSSLLERHKFFILLQVVVLAGTAIAFAPVYLTVKAVVPIALSIIAIIYFAVIGEFKERINILGCLGLLFLAAGYAILNPIVYLFGGAFLTIYSFIVYKKGATIGLLFGSLNLIFTITAMVSVYNHYIK